MEKIFLESERRQKQGKGTSKRMREKGFVPGVVYGKKIGNIQVAVNKKQVIELFRKVPHIENTIIELIIKNGSELKTNSIIRDYQTDVCSGKLLHLDFLEVQMDEKISLEIPIRIVGESEGVKKGGILEVILNSIEIECFPSDIPSDIEVDITNLDIGNVIHIKDIKVSDKIRILSEPEKVILLVTSPTAEEEKVPTAEEAAAAEGAAAEAEGGAAAGATGASGAGEKTASEKSDANKKEKSAAKSGADKGKK